MKKLKFKEIMKAAGIAVLSVGLFCTAFVYANHLAFASAVNGNEPIFLTASPIAAMPIAGSQPYTSPGEDEDKGYFVPPVFTIIDLNHGTAKPPAQAMQAEEAAQIGAYYIWDVFGESIDGMYITMNYTAWYGHARTHWAGTVHPTIESIGLDWEFDGENGHEDPFEPMFMFLIDAITGKRVDIMYFGPRVRQHPDGITADYLMEFRSSLSDTWFFMDVHEQMYYIGLTPEQLKVYTQIAKEFAARHFNNSMIADAELGNDYGTGLNIGPRIDENGNMFAVLEGLSFTITDDTGRIAHVRIPAEAGRSRMIRIETQGNDRIPGFSYDRPGLG